jgi:hypothetical protein
MRARLAVPAFWLLLSLTAAAGDAVHPSRLLQFSASLDGRSTPAGPAGVTFSVYAEQEGGVPLWSETQNVDVDAEGRFMVILGAMEDIPLEIFASGEARWLSIQRIPEAEQPRILLAAVPYALKAADADTLGGKPLSAFVLHEEPQERAAVEEPLTPTRPATSPAATLVIPQRPGAGGTSRRFTPTTNVAVSTGFQLSSASSGSSIGFGMSTGIWRIYLKNSITPGFDSSHEMTTVTHDELSHWGSIVGHQRQLMAGVVGYGNLPVGGTARGVYGYAEVDGGIGVQGSVQLHTGIGVRGEVTSGVGVEGESFNGPNMTGVRGWAKSPSGGVTSFGGDFDGGNGTGPNHGIRAVAGDFGVHATATGGSGAVYGVWGDAGDTAATNIGVIGWGGEWGVRGIATSTGGAALGGRSVEGGDLILMQDPSGSSARFRVTSAGNVQADGTFTSPAADLAERIDIHGAAGPGDVVEIDPNGEGSFRLCATPRSSLVAGVISTRPGVVLNDHTLVARPNDARPALALAGQVPVKVTSENGAIRPGDLLVSSSTPGHAMRADAAPAAGTIIGKALQSLDSGSGTIRMLVLFR